MSQLAFPTACRTETTEFHSFYVAIAYMKSILLHTEISGLLFRIIRICYKVYFRYEFGSYNLYQSRIYPLYLEVNQETNFDRICVETLNMLFFWKGKARFGVPPPQASCLLFNSIKSCRFRKLEETEFPHGLMTIAELFSALAIF